MHVKRKDIWLRFVDLRATVKGPRVRAMGGVLLQASPRSHGEGSGGIASWERIRAKTALILSYQPVFHQPRPVPFAIWEALGKELDRLEQEGIVERVDTSEWAAPIVPVPKKNGRIRLCGDYKVTVNPHLNVDQYPLPKPEDLFASLAGGQWFTVLDLAHAYKQMKIHVSL